jgi:hypothetical protein
MEYPANPIYRLRENAAHTLILNNLVAVFIHCFDDIFEHVMGVLQWVVDFLQTTLKTLHINLPLIVRIELLPQLLNPCIPRVLSLWDIHLREQMIVMVVAWRRD